MRGGRAHQRQVNPSLNAANARALQGRGAANGRPVAAAAAAGGGGAPRNRSGATGGGAPCNRSGALAAQRQDPLQDMQVLPNNTGGGAVGGAAVAVDVGAFDENLLSRAIKQCVWPNMKMIFGPADCDSSSDLARILYVALGVGEGMQDEEAKKIFQRRTWDARKGMGHKAKIKINENRHNARHTMQESFKSKSMTPVTMLRTRGLA